MFYSVSALAKIHLKGKVMYIVKNALRCISRSLGRNILIGIIVFVIAVSACIGLSIRQASQSAKEDTLSGMSITATISFDRQSMMGDMNFEEGGFDKDKFAEQMGDMTSLTLDDYQKYAEAESVQDFYYSMSASLDGSEDFEPVSTDTEDEEEESSNSSFGGFGGKGFGGMSGGFGGGRGMTSGDFSLTGYSSDSAMTSFINGTTSIEEGEVFESGTDSLDCIISSELATYNSVEVGDSIMLTNPNSEEETYTLTVVGIYNDSSANESFQMMPGSDPANEIYMSYAALESITEASAEVSKTVTDEDTGREYETAVTGNISATYVFADTDSYNAFEDEVRDLGLDDSYTVSSQDINAFENSLVPLETLSTMAGWFLLVILIIGAIILIVLNIFNVRERKYEIGVFMAIGMKKRSVAMQFMTEVFAVTMVAVMIGVCVGAVSSVPVTNALLENQIESSETQSTQIRDNFGRGEMPDMGNMGGGMSMPDMGNMGGGMSIPDSGNFQGIENIFGSGAANYVSEVNNAMNLTVVLQMLGIAILLTLLAGAVGVLFVMRYEPLKILANRD